jgi:triosephosphate isomerase (TIM)
MQKIIIANWKNKPKSLVEAKELFDKIAQGVKDIKNVEIVICPPFAYIPEIDNRYRISLGAQNCFVKKEEVSNEVFTFQAAKEAGCEYVICGHSSRKIFLGQTDEAINRELKEALFVDLRPIFCLGETREEREAGQTESVLKRQAEKGLADIAFSDISKIIFTYEPIWAISTGDPYQTKEMPTPEGVKKINSLIGQLVSENYGQKTDIRILYGGSANAQNSQGFLSVSDGLLVGGASLNPDEFIKMVKNI